jgi:uncharacterized protein (DUF1697 family)
MNRYVVLLRGINVGGNNLIKMKDLAACLAKEGFDEVVTYIASGNVLLSADEKNVARLTERIEKALEARFGTPLRVVVLSKKALQQIVEGAPKGFGQEPAKYRYDVLFLRPPLTAKSALQQVPIREGVDQAFAGKGALYYSRLISKATQSRLSKVVALPIYKEMTIRNWNTTSKLLALMDR